MAFSCATTRTVCRPRHGPGPGFCFPTWVALAGPHVISRPSSSNGHTRNPAEQNQRRRSRLNPSAHFPSPSLSSIHAATSERPRLLADERPVRGEEMGPCRHLEPLAGVRAHRWVDAPSSSSLMTTSLCARSLMRWRAPAPSWSPHRARIHKRCTGEIVIPTTHRLAMVRVLLVRCTDSRPAVVREVKISK
jgi:hypothetical protein